MSVGPGPAGDQAVVREVIARLDSTLAAPSARVELRSGFDDLIPPSRLLPPEDQPLPEGRQDAAAPRYRDPLAWLRLLRGVTEARYAGEETLRGTPCRKVILSKVLRELRPARAASQEDEKEDNPAEFMAWIDGHHVRQLETDVFLSGNRSLGTEILELWDFGVPVDSLDWTRFPGRPGFS